MAEPGPRIGLEVHCQLTTVPTKLFCACPSDYRDMEPNSTICPVCFGVPGALPVVSKRAVECAVMVGLALNSEISELTSFYRKNYYYPDLSKNFQTTQYDKAGGVPIATGGGVRMGDKTVRIRRVQLEEDPGKLTYEGTIERSGYSLVDYNRSGISLVEIVTEPDLSSPKEAKVFLEKLRTTLESLGVSNGELEGAMRCDANVSLGGRGRIEIKNISSFREVEKALSYEILRQQAFVGDAGRSGSETRHWDERRSITISLRVKEEEQDYRYFPEPDLVPIMLGKSDIERISRSMPELPDTRTARYIKELGLKPQVAMELARNLKLTRFFEECLEIGAKPVELANSVISDIAPHMTDGKIPISAADFSELVSFIDDKRITRAQAREVLREAVATRASPRKIVESRGLSAVTDESAIEKIVDRVLALRPELAEEARSNQKVFSYIIGQVLKEESKAEPKLIAKAISKRLRKR